jgi:hypothetical protein
MTLWLNKKEQQYLMAVIWNDGLEFPTGDEILSEGERDKLYEKIKAVKA